MSFPAARAKAIIANRPSSHSTRSFLRTSNQIKDNIIAQQI
jgi:hypothetical protein